MNRQPVNSSTVRSVGWENGTLQIEFSSGGVYDFAEVPEETYKAFMASESKGHFFQADIRARYVFVRLHIEGCEQIPLCLHPDVQCPCWCHKVRKDVSNAKSRSQAPEVTPAKAKKQKAQRPAI